MVDFEGHLSAVFFVSGCNFRCGFCHNPSLRDASREGVGWDRLKEACSEFRENWVDAAVVSGGEPTLHAGLFDLIGFFRDFGWAVKLDTNGSCPETLGRCLTAVDYVAMDVKAAPAEYSGLTGYSATDNIAGSMDLIRRGARDYEFRTTVIECFHTDDQMRQIGEMIRGAKRYVLQPFVPRDNLPDRTLAALKRTPPERLDFLRDLMSDYAVEVLVRGRGAGLSPVRDRGSQSAEGRGDGQRERRTIQSSS
jgi:pyruvate formate lyase activating enzyme